MVDCYSTHSGKAFQSKFHHTVQEQDTREQDFRLLQSGSSHGDHVDGNTKQATKALDIVGTVLKEADESYSQLKSGLRKLKNPD